MQSLCTVLFYISVGVSAFSAVLYSSALVFRPPFLETHAKLFVIVLRTAWAAMGWKYLLLLASGYGLGLTLWHFSGLGLEWMLAWLLAEVVAFYSIRSLGRLPEDATDSV